MPKSYVLYFNLIGPRKLFTRDEKLLLNKRIPDLAAATSVSYTCEALFMFFAGIYFEHLLLSFL